MEEVLFHSLETDHLKFKKLELEDSKEIHAYASDKEVSRFIGWPLMESFEDTQGFVREMVNKEVAGTHIYANIVEKSSAEIIGTVMLFNFDNIANKAEIGYVFHRKIWGQGYCSEAVKTVCDYGFKVLGLHKIHAQVTEVNIGSSRVLEKNEFEKEGQLKDHYFIDGQYYDCLLYGKI